MHQSHPRVPFPLSVLRFPGPSGSLRSFLCEPARRKTLPLWAWQVVAAWGLVLAIHAPGFSQTQFEWTNPNSSFYDIGGNWSPAGGPPGSTDVAQFNLNANYSVRWDGLTATLTPEVGFVDVIAGNVEFRNETLGTIDFTINEDLTLFGSGTQLSNNGLNLTVGGTTFLIGGAQFFIDNSRANSSSIHGGSLQLVEGLLELTDGANGSFGGPVVLNVNHPGSATLNILSGSTFSALGVSLGNGTNQFSSSSASILVSGNGSLFEGTSLAIGNTNGLGTHSLSVSDGGVANLGLGDVTVNRSGSVHVHDNGQINASGNWFIDGNVQIDSGGSLISGDVETGIAGNSQFINIDEAGSSWTMQKLRMGSMGSSTLRVRSGGTLNTDSATFGFGTDEVSASSAVLVTGIGSTWNNTGNLFVGSEDDGSGSVRVESGAQLNTGEASFLELASLQVIGNGSLFHSAGQIEHGGSLTVRDSGLLTASSATFGSGSAFISNQGGLHIQNDLSVSNLLVQSGGTVSSQTGTVATFGGARIDGEGSQWTVADQLTIGGTLASRLTVQNGGVVSSGRSTIAGSTSVVTVTDSGSRWDHSGGLTVASGSMVVELGGVVTSGADSDFSGEFSGMMGAAVGESGNVVVRGTGSRWDHSGILRVGSSGNGTLSVESGGNVSGMAGIVGFGSQSVSSASIAGADSQWNNSGDLAIGLFGNGTLLVEAGGVVTSANTTAGSESGSTGTIAVDGTGAILDTFGQLRIGNFGTGQLTINQGGVVNNLSFASIGQNQLSTGSATVSGQGSQWNSLGDLLVGNFGDGMLRVETGARVSSLSGLLGNSLPGIGSVEVDGPAAVWDVAANLQVGVNGQGMLTIQNGGRVSVGGVTSINPQSQVNLAGGRFEFGMTSNDDLIRVIGTGGAMAGTVAIQGIHELASLSGLHKPLVNLTEVQLENSGLLIGGGILGSSLTNSVGGELATTTGQQAFFAGSLDNSGEINNTGGVVRFGESARNRAGAFIAGRGVFGADGGWTNEGVMALSGTSDILGDLLNAEGGQIITTAGATTTFFDDVVHNGSEIRTSAGSQTVFFGELSGAGDFTGTGTVFLEGDLRPGNSPDAVSFAGDLVLGNGAHSFFELGGTDSGLFDQLFVSGDLSLAGQLTISLLDEFHLAANQEFLIANVDGKRTGQFFALDEGALVGSFGGRSLFISYGRGDGNDVALFTAIPEPAAWPFLMLGLATLGVRRRRGFQLIRPQVDSKKPASFSG